MLMVMMYNLEGFVVDRLYAYGFMVLSLERMSNVVDLRLMRKSVKAKVMPSRPRQRILCICLTFDGQIWLIMHRISRISAK